MTNDRVETRYSVPIPTHERGRNVSYGSDLLHFFFPHVPPHAYNSLPLGPPPHVTKAWKNSPDVSLDGTLHLVLEQIV